MTDASARSERDYDALKQAVEAAGFFTTFQPIETPGDRIVVSSGEFTGVSFWVAKRGPLWFMATWLPRLYRFPDATSVEAAVVEALRSHRGTPYDFKPELKTRYGLIEATDEEFDRA